MSLATGLQLRTYYVLPVPSVQFYFLFFQEMNIKLFDLIWNIEVKKGKAMKMRN